MCRTLHAEVSGSRCSACGEALPMACGRVSVSFTGRRAANGPAPVSLLVIALIRHWLWSGMKEGRRPLPFPLDR